MKFDLTKLAIRDDLANHLAYGTFAYWLGNFYSPHLGITLAIAVALLKDVLWDKLLGKGTFDPKDIVWTVGLPLLFFIQAII